MVAKINTSKRLLTALNYNEKKAAQGKATCMYAGNYLQQADQMNFYQKLSRLENQNKLNERATTKTLHISLNFDPKEKFSKDKLIEIAREYMDRINFKEQPYLVYQHTDAAHPHIHIVASAIRADGTRINTHNIGRNQSEKARKEIEILFNLVKAEHQKNNQQFIKPLDIQKIHYGNSATKKSIGSIVTYVMNTYSYTSLPEFNAALKQFNVVADRGAEDSIVYKTNGLLYRLTDSNNNKLGVPIKASAIFSKPTLAKLQTRFDINKKSRDGLQQKIKESIDAVITKHPSDLTQLIHALAINETETILRKNNEGKLYGITFIDNKNKSVFNGSDIGKKYSITGLQNLLTTKTIPPTVKDDTTKISTTSLLIAQPNKDERKHVSASLKDHQVNSLLDDLLSKERIENIPSSFKRKRKKKKRNNDL